MAKIVVNGCTLITLVLLVAQCINPPHQVVALGDPHSNSTHGPLCSDCPHGTMSFQECLYNRSHCNRGEVCSILYRGQDSHESISGVSIGCTSTCQAHGDHSSHCKYGGSYTSDGNCHICCKDDDCFLDFRRAVVPHSMITTTAARRRRPRRSHEIETALHCPSYCKSTNLQACSSRYTACTSSQYCNMVFNVPQNQFQGQCIDRSKLLICLSYYRNHQCPFTLATANAFYLKHQDIQEGYCYLGCCSANSCVDQVFLSVGVGGQGSTTTNGVKTSLTSTTASTVTTLPPKPSTSTSSTFTTALYPLVNSSASTGVNSTTTGQNPTVDYTSLMTSCSDKLQGNVCSVLRDFHDICRKPEAVRLCAQTYTICASVNAIKCEDMSTDSKQCESLQSGIGFCQDAMAVYACAKTCDLCDQVVKNVVDEVISRTPLPDFDHPPTTPATLHCTELLKSSCDHVKALCDVTNLKEICPQQCQTCS